MNYKLCITPYTDGGYTYIKTWPYGLQSTFTFMLLALDPLVVSDQLNHVQMVVTPCGIVSGVDHPGLGH